MKTIIIYHRINPTTDCPDGFAASWVAAKVYPDAEIIGCCYGDTPSFSNSRLVIVDFSFPASQLEKYADDGCQVIVIDHHKTAMNDLSNLSSRILAKFDMNECGATLTWKHFFPNEVVPAFLNYVKDRDLWNFDLPYSEEIHECVSSLRKSYTLYDVLEPLTQNELIKLLVHTGVKLLQPKRNRIKEIATTAKWRKVFDYEVLVVEIPYEDSRLVSDVCSYIYNTNPTTLFVVAIVKHKDEYLISFRSNKKTHNFDVSVLAKQLGGGGHRNAAGCKVTNLNWIS
jgi:oligoribonuclease NrnB/cAMP/cGMP phosphodiesterase (DHH superfamily)